MENTNHKKRKNSNKPKFRPPHTDYKSHYKCVALRFLVEFFNLLGISAGRFAGMTANPKSTAMALRTQFKADDMKLSKAMWVVEMLGFRLRVRFICPSDPMDDPDYLVRLPRDIMNRPGKKPRELDFLREFLRKKGISQRQLAHDLGISEGAVFGWFKCEDLAISYLVAIKNTYRVKLVFEIVDARDKGSR